MTGVAGILARLRRVNDSRGVQTDRVDLAAIADLLLAGRGLPVVAANEALPELSAWAAHRRRRIGTRTATRNQLPGQLPRRSAAPTAAALRLARTIAPAVAERVI